MLDNKGRLFGKVSVVDLFMLVAVVVAVIFVYRKMGIAAITTTAKGDEVVLKFYAEQAPECVGDFLEVGGRVMDEAKGVDMGRIISYEVGEGYDYFPDAEGNLVKSAKYGYCSVEVTSRLTAQLYENGVIIDGNKYGVGHSMTILAGKTKIYLRLSGIERE